MTIKKQLEPCDQYFIDERQHICPTYEMGWAKIPWKNAATFDDAIMGIASSPVFLEEIFPIDDWKEIKPIEWNEIRAKRHLNIEDGFFLVTGIYVSYGIFRFEWGDEVFFNMRPDFGFLSLATNLGEQPINEVELVVRNRLLDYYRETESIKRAIDVGEIDPFKLYTIEWWTSFWEVRGISIAKPGINEPVQKETKQERYARISVRVKEEKIKGTKAYLRVVAKEEGISVSRIKQIINANKTNPENSSWVALATSSRQSTSR